MKKAKIKDDILRLLINWKGNKYHGKTSVTTIADQLKIDKILANTLCFDIFKDENIYYDYGPSVPYCQIKDKGEVFLNIEGGYIESERKRRNSNLWKGAQNFIVVAAAILSVIISFKQCQNDSKIETLQQQINTLKAK